MVILIVRKGFAIKNIFPQYFVRFGNLCLVGLNGCVLNNEFHQEPFYLLWWATESRGGPGLKSQFIFLKNWHTRTLQHSHMHARTRAHTRTPTFTHTSTNTHTYIHIHTHTHTQTNTHTHTSTQRQLTTRTRGAHNKRLFEFPLEELSWSLLLLTITVSIYIQTKTDSSFCTHRRGASFLTQTKFRGIVRLTINLS